MGPTIVAVRPGEPTGARPARSLGVQSDSQTRDESLGHPVNRLAFTPVVLGALGPLGLAHGREHRYSLYVADPQPALRSGGIRVRAANEQDAVQGLGLAGRPAGRHAGLSDRQEGVGARAWP